ncbi:MAG: alpha/beta fold hydrolase [Bacteroidota bacterium]
MRFAIAFLLLSLVFQACQSPLTPTNSSPRFILSKKPPVKVDADKTPYTFGYLEVPENRQRPGSRMIQLPVYIFKSRSNNPAPDPVLYTVGGPGYTSMGAAPYMRAFAYLEDRDLILFEQRGTTHARPHLACPEWDAVGPALAGKDLSPAARDAAYAAAARQCRERLVAEGVDLDGYRTQEIAADIEDLRKALNIDQLNLLTTSYSTKIAQVMMRDYSSNLRSVVMDSPLPLAVSYDETSITNLMETYQQLFKDCAQDPNCADKHPNLESRFYSFLDSIQDDPIRFKVPAPQGKGQRQISLTGKDLVWALANTKTARIPSFLAKLEATMAGDSNLLQSFHTWPTGGTGEGKGMRLSVWCAEETAFVDTNRVREEMERFPALAGLSPVVFSYEVCRSWDVRKAPPEDNEPVLSSVPTLLISGSYDTDTPVKWAADMQRQLRNSHHLIFPGWTHGPTTYWDDPCAMQAARAFFSTPGRKPEVPCLDALKLPEFE